MTADEAGPKWLKGLVSIHDECAAEASLHPGRWIERALNGADFFLLCGRRKKTGQRAVKVRALRTDSLEWITFELEAKKIARELGVDGWEVKEERRWFGHELQFLQPEADATPYPKVSRP